MITKVSCGEENDKGGTLVLNILYSYLHNPLIRSSYMVPPNCKRFWDRQGAEKILDKVISMNSFDMKLRWVWLLIFISTGKALMPRTS